MAFDGRMLENDEPSLRGHWHPVARSVDVSERPTAARLNGDDYVLARGGPHVRRGHGHEDEPWDAVEVSGGPVAAVEERYGLVWVAQETPVHDLPHLPEWYAPDYHSAVLLERTHVSAGVLTDNFLDVTHFSYLHRQSFGRSRPVTDDGYSIRAEGESVVLRHDTVLEEGRRNAAGGFGERRIATYTYWPAYTTHLQMHFPTDGTEAAATLVCQPESASSTMAYVLVLVPTADPGLDDQVAFSRRVLQEDLMLVERMADPRLCLDVRTELHTRADRASVEMRRLLRRRVEQSAASVVAAGAPA